ncbi:hypothetical protein Agub_g3368 [Astrephomene gubernaculifera]|uniref:Selenoprotein t n=1 Tax=Astrephomene gubernaculifera TaxID=47775 RepID=A0AAD3DIH7_9CHLO|nr:hypothetical protein Agub_g3368 [Astrephomene gubernaculifera]
MRGAFGQVYQLTQTRYPGLEVIGTHYPVPAWKYPFIRAAQFAQLSLIAVCIFGDRIFRHLGIPPPEWYTRHVVTNRFGAVFGVWFAGNFIMTNLQNTGAFEVYYDGQLIFSKLAEGRMPTLQDLVGPLDALLLTPAAVAARAAAGVAAGLGAAAGVAGMDGADAGMGDFAGQVR